MDNFLLASKDWKSIDIIKKRLNNKYNVKDMGNIKTIIRL